MELSKKCREIILGSVLGDGSLKIHSGYRNARFSFRHSVKQEEYFWWKVSFLEEISGRSFAWRQSTRGTDGYGYEKLRYQSRALEALTELYGLTHQNGELVARESWLDQLSPLSLAIWWLDDGSIIGSGRQGVLCTDNFSRSVQLALVGYLERRWGIKVGPSLANGRIRLAFYGSSQLKKFLRIILPCLQIESMMPKVLLLYKDVQLQQRWTSEVAELTPFSSEVVETYLRRKKKKWRHFRG